MKRKYHFVDDLSWYNGEWKLEGSNRNELGKVE